MEEVPDELSRSTNPIRAMHEYCLGSPAVRTWKSFKGEWTDPAWTAYVDEDEVPERMRLWEAERAKAREEQGKLDSEELPDPLDKRYLVGFTATAEGPNSRPIEYYIQFRVDDNDETVLEVLGGKDKLKWFAIDHDHVRSGARAMFDEGMNKLTAEYNSSSELRAAMWLLVPGYGMSRRIDDLNSV